jgi:hypothetical protein
MKRINGLKNFISMETSNGMGFLATFQNSLFNSHSFVQWITESNALAMPNEIAVLQKINEAELTLSFSKIIAYNFDPSFDGGLHGIVHKTLLMSQMNFDINLISKLD